MDDVIKALQYFCSKDGPHIPIKTLAIYCAVNYSTMKDYISERYSPPPEVRRRMEKGLTEMMREMHTEWHT